MGECEQAACILTTKDRMRHQKLQSVSEVTIVAEVSEVTIVADVSEVIIVAKVRGEVVVYSQGWLGMAQTVMSVSLFSALPF